MPGRSSFTDQPDLWTEMPTTPFSGQPTSGGMANPFAGILGGGGGGTPAPSGAPAPRSYNALLDPSRSGVFGVLGGLMGNPTRQEHQQQVVGSARAKGFQSLADAITAGVPPQKAILQFVETPEGQNFFATSSDPAAELAQFMNQTVGKPKEDYSLGNQRFSGATNEVIATGAEQPTEAVRTFNAMAQLANLSDEERTELARTKLLTAQGDPTQEEAAWNRLIQQGKADRNTADLNLAGAIKIMPVKDLNGNVVGNQVVNTLDNTVIDLKQGVPQSAQEPTPLDEPPYDPKKTVPGEPLRRLKELGMSPADIVDGAGPVGAFGEKVGGIMGNVPGFAGSGRQTSLMRQGLNSIAADANTLLDMYSKQNRASKADSDNIKTIIGGITGLATNPGVAAEKLIAFNDYLDTREQIATQDRANPNNTQQTRGDADVELNAIRRARANLPTREELKAKLTTLDAGPSAIEKVIPDIEKGIGTAEKEIGGKPAAPFDWSKPVTKEQAMKAVNDGVLKKEDLVGKTIIINGKPTLIGPPKGK